MAKRDAANQELDLQQIIAGPVRAAVDADSYAARSYIETLREYAFSRPPSDDPYDFGELRMVSFCYDTPNERGQMQTHVIRVPLISLIPLPILEVTEASFDFNVRILSHVYEEEPASKRADKAAPWTGNKNDGQLRFRGVLANRGTASRAESRAVTAHIGAKIQVRRADMPAGVGQLLNVLQNGIIRQSTLRKLIVLTSESSSTTVTVQALFADKPAQDQTIIAVPDDESAIKISHVSRKTDVGGKATFKIERLGAGTTPVRIRFLWDGPDGVSAELHVEATGP